MDVVLFHSGQTLPVYLECTFNQFRLFNPDARVFFITDIEHLNNLLFSKYGITPLDKDAFYSDKIDEYNNLYNYPSDHFWSITTTRLTYIENFLEYFELTDVYHFENDILIYYSLDDHHKMIKTLYSHMAITPGGPDRNMTGLLYIKDQESLSLMTQFFIDVIRIHGLAKLRKMYKTDMVHEMSLMKMYEIERGSEHLGYLPILPFGEHSNHFDKFNSIFDPATWGQYVGGTTAGIPGVKPLDHYIGRVLEDNPEYDVIWKKEDERKVPYFKYEDNEVKINNLHIHSKNLSKYMSYA